MALFLVAISKGDHLKASMGEDFGTGHQIVALAILCLVLFLLVSLIRKTW